MFFITFRILLKEILGDVDTVIPDHLDQLTLWKIILNMVSEPPRRKKLANVNTLQDVVELIRNSKKIIILTEGYYLMASKNIISITKFMEKGLKIIVKGYLFKITNNNQIVISTSKIKQNMVS